MKDKVANLEEEREELIAAREEIEIESSAGGADAKQLREELEKRTRQIQQLKEQTKGATSPRSSQMLKEKITFIDSFEIEVLLESGEFRVWRA